MKDKIKVAIILVLLLTSSSSQLKAEQKETSNNTNAEPELEIEAYSNNLLSNGLIIVSAKKGNLDQSGLVIVAKNPAFENNTFTALSIEYPDNFAKLDNRANLKFAINLNSFKGVAATPNYADPGNLIMHNIDASYLPAVITNANFDADILCNINKDKLRNTSFLSGGSLAKGIIEVTLSNGITSLTSLVRATMSNFVLDSNDGNNPPTPPFPPVKAVVTDINGGPIQGALVLSWFSWDCDDDDCGTKCEVSYSRLLSFATSTLGLTIPAAVLATASIEALNYYLETNGYPGIGGNCGEVEFLAFIPVGCQCIMATL